jgi:hypothetical protein
MPRPVAASTFERNSFFGRNSSAGGWGGWAPLGGKYDAGLSRPKQIGGAPLLALFEKGPRRTAPAHSPEIFLSSDINFRSARLILVW